MRRFMVRTETPSRVAAWLVVSTNCGCPMRRRYLMWGMKATDRQTVRAPGGELPPVSGAFVTFCDTFRVWHSHFHSHLPGFYREDGGCFL
jgi:hypothetical protein